MTGFSSSGHINDPQFVFTLKNIATKKLEGIMRVEGGKFKKELYFKEGLLVGGRSNILKETFGRVLFENGLLSRSDYEDSLKEVLEKKKKHGAVLQERGLLPININDALKLQLRMRFVYTFAMIDGIFHFREVVLPESITSQFAMSLFSLIVEGVKLHMPREVLEEFVRSNSNTIYTRGTSQYDPGILNLTQEELNLLLNFTGDKTLKQVLSGVKMKQEDAMSLVYLFLGFGFIEPKKQTTGIVEKRLEKPLLTEDQKRLLEEFKDKLDELRDKNYYEYFNVDQQAGSSAIKKAYFTLAKQYHPDHFFDYPAEIKEVASDIFTLITTAYETLTNDEERKKYDEYLKSGKKQIENNEADKIVKAELQFQKGLILLKTNNIKEAYEQFKWAVDLNPTEGEYLSYYGWTIFRLSPDSEESRTKALDYIQRGLQLNKEQDAGYYFLGRILKVKGDEQKAIEAFKTAYAKNQQNIDALREIRAYELSQKSSKGTFKKFFK
ncbi:MAG: J domain-containing protein [bacterium]